MEEWKIWKETSRSLWEVSDQGNVKRNGELYKCRLNNKGYKVFGSVWLVHRAVAKLFIPNPENKFCVDHINTNHLDNRAENLQWVTYKENSNNPITLKHQSELKKGRKLGPQSEEHRRKRSESMKGKNKGKRPWNKNKSRPEETRHKISEAMKRYYQNKKSNK